ncbi:MAG: FAD-binding oxidoreductase [Clostridiales bacterium]|jgi:sarcosine oxidase subunit beta|nr:FAD-binding oxidoreductase [Clostridiales bacterium]
MKNTADYVIIGGGISGVTIGYFLMKYGAKNVVILERDYLAAGATGRCGAGIRQQWGTELNCLMAKFSCEFFENAKDELEIGDGIDIEFHQGGYLLLISTERELAQTKKNIALQNSLGIASRLLGTSEINEIAPALSTEGILAGAFHERDGHLNPFHTTQAFARAFVRLGGIIHTNTNVSRVTTDRGRVTGVDTNRGHIATDCVINAAGGYSQQVAAMAGVSLPLYSVRHNILVTEAVERALNPVIMSFSLNFYCQQVPHGSFIMGRTCENQPRDLRVTADSAFPVAMAKTITRAMPPLKKLRMLRQWAGLYNMSPDKCPIYSAAPGLAGFYTAAGYSGHGFMLAPATGQSMAELILGHAPTLPWPRLGLSRFEKGDLILEPSVV